MKVTASAAISPLSTSVCGSLADPHQVFILYQLRHGQQTVGQLAGALGVSVQDIRQHLQTLCQSRLIIADYSWPTAQYRLCDGRLVEALEILQAVGQDSAANPAEIAALRPYLWAQSAPDAGC